MNWGWARRISWLLREVSPLLSQGVFSFRWGRLFIYCWLSIVEVVILVGCHSHDKVGCNITIGQRSIPTHGIITEEQVQIIYQEGVISSCSLQLLGEPWVHAWEIIEVKRGSHTYFIGCHFQRGRGLSIRMYIYIAGRHSYKEQLLQSSTGRSHHCLRLWRNWICKMLAAFMHMVDKSQSCWRHESYRLQFERYAFTSSQVC